MLSIDEMIINREKLSSLLLELKLNSFGTNPGYFAEYGLPSDPGGPLSYLRVSWIRTHGGEQFRLCELYNGREGSGQYTPDLSEMLLLAEQMVHYYHRRVLSNPLRRALDGRRQRGTAEFSIADQHRKLCWFLSSISKPPPELISSCAAHTPLEGEVLVNLEAPK